MRMPATSFGSGEDMSTPTCITPRDDADWATEAEKRSATKGPGKTASTSPSTKLKACRLEADETDGPMTQAERTKTIPTRANRTQHAYKRIKWHDKKPRKNATLRSLTLPLRQVHA
jgi:hypothetical protein